MFLLGRRLELQSTFSIYNDPPNVGLWMIPITNTCFS
uniref:Uncharacterized protein n=1 Tax=Rhizophora mucronata TaxID=61149 RepID=A0A2P2P9J7_RHIMU